LLASRRPMTASVTSRHVSRSVVLSARRDSANLAASLASRRPLTASASSRHMPRWMVMSARTSSTALAASLAASLASRRPMTAPFGPQTSLDPRADLPPYARVGPVVEGLGCLGGLPGAQTPADRRQRLPTVSRLMDRAAGRVLGGEEELDGPGGKPGGLLGVQ